MIHQQVKYFTKEQRDLDYRTIFHKCKSHPDGKIDNMYILHQYLHPPLVRFIEEITGVNSSQDSSQPLTLHKQQLKILTIIALLCNVRNWQSILLQTVLGLAAYANGLRDKGFQLMNMFGVVCGIRHLREEAAKWSNKRKCIDEINMQSFWRVTFDNLNFKRKFAKTFKAGGEVLGRMLNLITGQVTHRETNSTCSDTVTIPDNMPSMSTSDRFPVTLTRPLTETDFLLQSHGETKCAKIQFLEAMVHVQRERCCVEVKQLQSTLVIDMHAQMAHFYTSEIRQSGIYYCDLNTFCQY